MIKKIKRNIKENISIIISSSIFIICLFLIIFIDIDEIYLLIIGIFFFISLIFIIIYSIDTCFRNFR